ncbi:MAG: DNA-binding response regulator [Gammaproteobacteria bacterium]|nr:MAG: DNA-binding response regulator [Gammaproteobacteria bacterium]
MIRVVVIDDQTIVRQGICTLLEISDKISVAGEAGNGLEGLEVIIREKPDVILSDIRMPEMDGIELVEKMKHLGIDIPTILLTTFDDHEVVLDGIKSGIKGYMLKDVSLKQLVEAIETVVAGETMIQPAITNKILKGLTQEKPAEKKSVFIGLTNRETEILRLMAGGYSNKEIAQALELTEGTIKNHVSNILSKLDVRDRTRAVLKAVENSLI